MYICCAEKSYVKEALTHTGDPVPGTDCRIKPRVWYKQHTWHLCKSPAYSNTYCVPPSETYAREMGVAADSRIHMSPLCSLEVGHKFSVSEHTEQPAQKCATTKAQVSYCRCTPLRASTSCDRKGQRGTSCTIYRPYSQELGSFYICRLLNSDTMGLSSC